MPKRQEEEPDWESDGGDDDDNGDEEETEDGEETTDDDDDEETSEGDEETEDDEGTEDAETEDDDEEDDDKESEDDESDEDDDEDDDDEDDFEDEPDEEKGLAASDEEDDDAFNDEDRPKSDPAIYGDEDKRKRMLLIAAAVACLAAIILAVGLGVGLTRDNDDDGPAPTPSPTPAPVSPTNPPTRISITTAPADPTEAPNTTAAPTGTGSPPPGVAIATSSADNTIYRDGLLVGDSNGDRDFMLVQNTPSSDAINLPNAYALVQFTFNETEYPWFMRDEIAIQNPTATLCMVHINNVDDVGERSINYDACLLPPTPLDVAALTGNDVNYTIPDDCVGGKVATFAVGSDSSEVCFDVTGLMFDTPDIITRRRRKLQEDDETYLFIIDNPVEQDAAGDQFYTRNAVNATLWPQLSVVVAEPNNTFAPTLSLLPSEAPTVTAQPTVTPGTTTSPSLSFQPTTTFSPSLSVMPTAGAPVGSPTDAPVGGSPTDAPIVPVAPSAESPTAIIPVAEPPCSICGEGQIVTFADGTFPIPPDIVFTNSDEISTCADAEFSCATGACNETVCENFAGIASEFCSCAAANEPCPICPDGGRVTIPDAIIEIPAGLAPPGIPETVPCGDAETLCALGGCTGETCQLIQQITNDLCGCAAA